MVLVAQFSTLIYRAQFFVQLVAWVLFHVILIMSASVAQDFRILVDVVYFHLVDLNYFKWFFGLVVFVALEDPCPSQLEFIKV